MKRVLIVGGGISGVFFSIRLKEKHPDYEVIIFEHNDKLLKKIYATGNGKCNFANKGDLKDKYSSEDFALPILKEFDYQEIVNYFRHIGVESKNIGDLFYPYSESAETIANALLKKVDELNIEVHLLEDVVDYKDYTLITDKGQYHFDYLIISSGGKAAPQLGTDGKLLETITKNSGGYIKEPQPSLCPIVTKENTHSVEGLRHKCFVTLKYRNEKTSKMVIAHQEEGEVLFKKDGLSGIVIYNISHYINVYECYKNAEIHLDFAPNKEGEYESLLHPRLAKYLKSHNYNIHDTVFHFKKFYDFKNAQVSGHVFDTSKLNKDLSLKNEKNIYFIGEATGIYALCGGYNIMWALASANKVAKSLCRHKN